MAFRCRPICPLHACVILAGGGYTGRTTSRSSHSMEILSPTCPETRVGRSFNLPLSFVGHAHTGASEAILKWAGHGKSLSSSESTFAFLILSYVIENMNDKDGNLLPP